MKITEARFSLSAAQLLELVRRCPELEKLEVRRSGHQLADQLTDSWLGEVVGACPQLTCLDLGKGDAVWKPRISEAGILAATAQRPRLKIMFRK